MTTGPAVVTGLVFAGPYAWRKELWEGMATHIAFDLTAVVLIYKVWEAGAAHLLLR
jgi:membrane protease YdiL (CAAX protease family)